MPRRKTMRRIRDCLRLYYESKLNQSEISRSLNLSRSTVQDYLTRFTTASLSYETSRSLSDSELDARSHII
jgi:DNA-binding transcriptional regulator LsrR (DeoR family)